MAGVPLSLKVAIPDAAELGVGIRTVEHYRKLGYLVDSSSPWILWSEFHQGSPPPTMAL